MLAADASSGQASGNGCPGAWLSSRISGPVLALPLPFVSRSMVACPEIVPSRAFVASAIMILASTAEAGKLAVAHPVSQGSLPGGKRTAGGKG